MKSRIYNKSSKKFSLLILRLYSISDDIITDDAVESDTTSSEGIGNPVIDANPNRYMPEGITGTIDNEYGVFCSNKPTKDIIPGEYLIVGGGTSVVNISDLKSR